MPQFKARLFLESRLKKSGLVQPMFMVLNGFEKTV